ncbi:hypothetical protein BST61_g6687 [Cercospora zeina]
MAPSPVADHYTRYKLGTAKIIGWLTQQAQRIAERDGDTANLSGPFTTKTLLRLAKSVKLAKPGITVPLSILLVTEDVIRGRKCCADFFAQLEVKSGEGKFKSTNSSHRYFISVLEEVRDCLKTLEIERPAAKVSASSGGGSSKSTGKVPASGKKNIFETLGLEEPFENLHLATFGAKKAGPKSKDGSSTPDLEEDRQSEIAMSVWCLFEDIREIRTHLHSVWREFYDGKISFLAATELTQIGFVFIQHIACGLRWNDDDSKVAYDAISGFLDMKASLDDAGDIILAMNNAEFDAAGDVAELLCVPAWLVLNDFRACIFAAHDTKYKHRRYSYHPFADTLRQCEPILRHMTTVMGDEPTGGDVKGFWMDTFTQNLLGMCHNRGPIPIETVAWCQVLLDALAAFGGQPSLGNDILQSTLKRGSYETRFNDFEQRFPGTHDPEYAQHVRETLALGDPDGIFSSLDERRSRGLAGSHPWPSDRNPEDLLNHLPLLAGFRLCHIKTSHCIASFRANVGSGVEVDHAAVLSMAYIYRAARSIGLVRREWADMETVVASQAMEGLYVRDADNLAGYARHFDLAIGVPATAFARNATQRPKIPGKSTMETKMKKLHTPSNFARRRAQGEEMLASGLSNYNAFYTSLYQDAEAVTKAPSTHMTSVELLRTIQRGMEVDEVYLKFDYLAFGARCRAMFSNFPTPAEMARIAKLVVGKDDSPPDVIDTTHAVLWQAADTPLYSQTAEIPLLASFADFIEVIASHDGSALLAVARDGTSGHIGPTERPASKWAWGGGLVE